MDVQRDPGDRSLQPRRPHLPEEVPVSVAHRRQRPQEELHPAGGGLDGRLQEVLLRADRK